MQPSRTLWFGLVVLGCCLFRMGAILSRVARQQLGEDGQSPAEFFPRSGGH